MDDDFIRVEQVGSGLWALYISKYCSEEHRHSIGSWQILHVGTRTDIDRMAEMLGWFRMGVLREHIDRQEEKQGNGAKRQPAES